MVASKPNAPRLAVSGWRGMTDANVFAQAVQDFVLDYGLPSVIITGGARGADALAEAWARKQGVPLRVLKPVYVDDNDRLAPLRRNDAIVALCTHLLAFPSKQGSGTQYTIGKARAAGKVVVEIKLH